MYPRIVTGCFLLAASLSHAEPAPRVLSLAEATQLAANRAPEIRASSSLVEHARHELEAVSSTRLPTLSAEANLLMWDRAIEFRSMQPDGTVNTSTLRERITSTGQLTLRMPLTGQLAIADEIAGNRAGLAARTAEHEGVRQDAAARAAIAYLELLHAEAAAHVVATEVEQITSQLDVVRALERSGVLEPVDRMRIESALASARSRTLRAKADVEIGRDRLGLVLGLQAPVTGRDDFAKTFRPATESLETLLAKAARQRPELVAARHRVAEFRSAADHARSRMLPDVSAVATYQHTLGQGAFAPQHAWAVGLSLSWDIWTWGGDRARVRAARALADRQISLTERLLETSSLEVRIAVLEVTSAYDQLAAVAAALAAAEEAYRIQNERFQRGVVTTTDLLEVRTELTRAQLENARARYAYLRALVGIARITGEHPTRLLSQL